MTNTAFNDLPRIALSAVGAALLSATCLVAAAGPAKAETTTAAREWQANVQSQMTAAPAARQAADAVLSLGFDANGAFRSARILRSTGSEALDGQAVAMASRLAYPSLPQGTRSIRMRLWVVDGVEDRTAAQPRSYVRANAATELAQR